MHLRTALAASVSVAALLSTTFAATAQTDLTALYEAAKAEGQLTTIALPHTWCGYGEVIEAFKAKYPGITVNELNPDAGSKSSTRRAISCRWTPRRRCWRKARPASS